MIKNQVNQRGKHGGIREGSGRKIGSFKKPRFNDNVTEDQAKSLVDKAIKLANQGDPSMIRFVIEHIMGRAVQPTDMTVTAKPKPILPAPTQRALKEGTLDVIAKEVVDEGNKGKHA